MIRTVIAIDDDDKAWLDNQARKKHVSMATVIREAIHSYRQAKEAEPSFEQLLELTKGIWEHGDGLKYQTKIRNEWEE